MKPVTMTAESSTDGSAGEAVYISDEPEKQGDYQPLLLPAPVVEALETIEPEKRRCSVKTAAGAPCQGRAVHGTDPPLCTSHNGRCGAVKGNQISRSHGFFSRTYTLQEIADLVEYAEDMTLKNEIALARVATRRIMERLQVDLAPADYAHLAYLAFRGVNTIARLLRTQRKLVGEPAEGFSGAIGQALDLIGDELNLDL